MKAFPSRSAWRSRARPPPGHRWAFRRSNRGRLQDFENAAAPVGRRAYYVTASGHVMSLSPVGEGWVRAKPELSSKPEDPLSADRRVAEAGSASIWTRPRNTQGRS